MDRYQKVEKPKTESSPINENEIRITSQGAIRNYITYATSLLQEKHGKDIVLKAMGQAISKTVAISEIIKKRVPRLHQDTSISSVSITDVWEPIEEGLVPVEMTRHVSMISITLSTRELDKNSPGYQAPHVEQSKPQNNSYQQRPPVRQVRAPYNAMTEDSFQGRGRGRGSGRGRGQQNWSRGGYGNYQDDVGYSNHGRGGYRNYQNDGGYSNHGRGGYRNYQDDGGYSNHGRGGYRNYQDDGGYSNYGRGGYRNYQDDGGYQNYGRGGYRNYQDYGGYSNWGRGGGRGRDWGGRGAGYERGRGGGGRGGYGRGRGRNSGRGRMGGDSMGRGY